MMYAPFIEDSDDQLSQMAQLQIFLTLLSSLALRTTPPSEFVGNLVTAVLFAVPLLGLALETPLLELVGMLLGKLKELLSKLFPNIQRPPLSGTAAPPPPTKESETADRLGAGAFPVRPEAVSASDMPEARHGVSTPTKHAEGQAAAPTASAPATTLDA